VKTTPVTLMLTLTLVGAPLAAQENLAPLESKSSTSTVAR
jgi:hypothetical protein